ncbi:alpha/beta hydrolase [Nocardiopsis sp. CT-R113]|uniref:Alpha/beta hydrolase n=1 Tax=Nocardiopsis codii TaxID=3065942 RepID=A0ABU7K766_9ACTN|nr:alpha/beta hydrolase [Nocardiopsis sp. CT-R113]MEE2038080.1 alpha/beta hydrolase [Nocardiopsis sp. CT-R113]
MSTHEPEVRTLKVPGARIHHEVRGSGPVLLMIPGGPQDAGVLAEIARLLADRYTTVTYDPRGNSRSTLDGEPVEQEVDVHADDAARLIAELGGGPVDVFGTSGGGQVGLALTARYPDLVRVLVAHEPACVPMLDDPAAAEARDRHVYDTYLREGVDAAMVEFLGLNGLDVGEGAEGDALSGGDGPPPGEEELATFERVSGNFDYFLRHGLLPISLYRPDVEALAGGAPRVVVGLGAESEGELIHDIGLALAGRLGSAPVGFPGDHLGYDSHPDGFSETLHRVLREA